MKTALYVIHALSPLHAGTGQSVGAIDLPIARERPTGIPLVPGSSIKGALRARCDEKDSDRFTIFGPEKDNASDYAGAVQFSDAHLLLLPVRSIAGTFAWVTSPYLLQRFARDAKEGGRADLTFTGKLDGEGKCFVGNDKAAIKADLGTTKRVILEDLDFEAVVEPLVDNLARQIAAVLFSATDTQWHETLRHRLCIVHDDVMSLLLETATEIVARIKLNTDTKTVDSEAGALWYEEALPTESVLYGLVVASGVTKERAAGKTGRVDITDEKLIQRVDEIANQRGMLQLGGKGTVGRGVCALRIANHLPPKNAPGKAGAK